MRSLRKSTRGRSLAAIVACALVTLLIVATQPTRRAYSATLPGTPDTALNNLFNGYGDNAGCATWSGGDSTNTLLLDDGSRAWFFADTYLNSPQSRHEDGGFFHSFIHNSIVKQNGDSLGPTITGGNTCREHDTSIDFWSRYAKTPIAPSGSDAGWYWNSGVTDAPSTHDHKGLVVAYYYHGFPIEGGSFGIDYPVAAVIPAAELNESRQDNVIKPGTDFSTYRLSCDGGSEPIIWGADVTRYGGGGGYDIYGWGAESRKLYYAQAPGDQDGAWNFGKWTFDTGGGQMSSDCRLAKPMPMKVESGFTVTLKPNDTHEDYWLIQHDPGSLTSGKILAYHSSTPYGFDDSKAVVLYDASQMPHQSPYWHLMYDARAFDLGGNKLTISYNINTTGVSIGCGSANNWDGDIYRPRFIDVPYSALNTANAVSTGSVTTKAAPSLKPPGGALAGHGIHSFTAGQPEPPSTVQRPTTTTALGAAAPAPLALPSGPWYDSWDAEYAGHSRCPFLENEPATQLTGQVEPDGTVDMAWNGVGRDVWYWIYWKDSTAGEDWQRVELWSDGTTYKMNPITSASLNGHKFCWYIQPFASGNQDILGKPSNQLCGNVTVQRPSAPTGVTAAGADVNTVRVNWTGVTDPNSHVFYYIHYRTGSGSWTKVGPWDENTRSALVAPLTAGQTYQIYVTAVNTGGESDPSNIATVVVPS